MISNVYSNDGYEFFEQRFKNRQDLISYLKNAKTSVSFSSSFDKTKANHENVYMHFVNICVESGVPDIIASLDRIYPSRDLH